MHPKLWRRRIPIIVIGPNAVGSDYPIQVIVVHYTAAAFESLTVAELLKFPDVFPLAHDEKADAMLNEACREYTLRPMSWERGLESLLHRLLLHLIRDHEKEIQMDAHESKLVDLRRLLRAIEWMRRNLGKPIFIPDLTRLTGMTGAQSRRVFRRTMGMSSVQYLRRIHMESARQLLRQTNQTVEAILSQVGYLETAFFAFSFKKVIGASWEISENP